MDRADYEWHYYIGGNMALSRRKYGGNIATIDHYAQGRYEAFIERANHESWSLGVYCYPDEAQDAVEEVLKPQWEIK